MNKCPIEYVNSNTPTQKFLENATLNDMKEKFTKFSYENDKFTGVIKDDTVRIIAIENIGEVEKLTITQCPVDLSKEKSKDTVKQLRSKDYTQVETAEIIGKSQSTVSRLEREGKKMIYYVDSK